MKIQTGLPKSPSIRVARTGSLVFRSVLRSTRPLNESGIHHSFKSMRKPTRQPQETDRSKPKKRRDLLLATGNKRLAQQVRKILGKHYASKYRVR